MVHSTRTHVVWTWQFALRAEGQGLSCHHLDPSLHRWLCEEWCVDWRTWGSVKNGVWTGGRGALWRMLCGLEDVGLCEEYCGLEDVGLCEEYCGLEDMGLCEEYCVDWRMWGSVKNAVWTGGRGVYMKFPSDSTDSRAIPRVSSLQTSGLRRVHCSWPHGPSTPEKTWQHTQLSSQTADLCYTASRPAKTGSSWSQLENSWEQ